MKHPLQYIYINIFKTPLTLTVKQMSNIIYL